MSSPHDIRSRLVQARIPHADEVAALAAPAIRIVTEPAPMDALGLGESRLGGVPDLPDGLAWPTRHGRPLSFIAQIDLAAARAPGVAAAGWLALFYDAKEQPWGFDPSDADGSRVCFIPPGTPLVRATPPPGLPDEGVVAACRCQFVPVIQLPDLYDGLCDSFLRGMTDEQDDAYVRVARGLAGATEGVPYHQLLGHPWLEQFDMRDQCQLVDAGIDCGEPAAFKTQRARVLLRGALEWHLLLQIDSDEAPGWMWGDVGRIYVWNRQRDLATGSFERVRVILQSG